jgi:hypothetical protein
MCFEKQSQNLLLERLRVTAGMAALEYHSLQQMPSLVITGPKTNPRGLATTGVTRPALPPSALRDLTDDWLRRFPLRPSESNFAFARLVRHGLLLAEVFRSEGRAVPEALADAVDRARASQAGLVEWLESMPRNADPSFGPMYVLAAHTPTHDHLRVIACRSRTHS